MAHLEKVTIYGWMRDLNLRGSDLYVFAAYNEAGREGISICAETSSAACLLGMHVSTFTRTRDRLLVGGLLTYREVPGRGRTYFAAGTKDTAMPEPVKPSQRPRAEPRNPVRMPRERVPEGAYTGGSNPYGAESAERKETYGDEYGEEASSDAADSERECAETAEKVLEMISGFVELMRREAEAVGRVRDGLYVRLEKTHAAFLSLDDEVCLLLKDVGSGRRGGMMN